MTPLMWLIAALAAARCWRLLALDEISEPLRDRFDTTILRLAGKKEKGRRRTFAEKLSTLFYCPWCMGFYWSVAFVATGLAWSDTWPWQLIAGAFAASYVVGQLSAHLESDDD